MQSALDVLFGRVRRLERRRLSSSVVVGCNVGCATVREKMPFYQFNSFTGRLKPSTNLQPFYPVVSVDTRNASR